MFCARNARGIIIKSMVLMRFSHNDIAKLDQFYFLYKTHLRDLDM